MRVSLGPMVSGTRLSLILLLVLGCGEAPSKSASSPPEASENASTNKSFWKDANTVNTESPEDNSEPISMSKSELVQAIEGRTWHWSDGENLSCTLVIGSRSRYSKHFEGALGVDYQVVGTWYIAGQEIVCAAPDDGLIPGDRCQYTYNDGNLVLVSDNGVIKSDLYLQQ